MSTPAAPAAVDPVEARQSSLPPTARLATLTLAFILSAGVYMAANTSRAASMVPADVIAVIALLCLVANVVLLARTKEFAWNMFFLVFRWALLAYAIIAGILEFVFVFDHTPSSRLAILTTLLLMFALDVPLILAFSVARYQPLPSDAS